MSRSHAVSPPPPPPTGSRPTAEVDPADRPTRPIPPEPIAAEPGALAKRLRILPPPKVEVWGTTDRGHVRKANEDQYLVAELDRGLGVRRTSLEARSKSFSESPQGLLLAVADGVGGRAGGAVASATAVKAMAHDVLTVMPWVFGDAAPDGGRLEAWISDAFKRTQRKMRRVAERRGIDPRMATTFTMAYVTWPDLVVAHVGDSRCYLLRDGTLQVLTSDHTMARHLVEQGHLDPAKASPFDHMLVNTLGGSTDELWVELHRAELQPGDQLLLCSDGLTGHLRDHELREHLTRERSVEEAVEDLVAHANARGGKDNITVVVARF